MAQEQNWWESAPVVATPDQTTGSGSIYVPPAPEKPDLPAPTRDTESWVRMTPEEVQASGLNPAQPYQRNRAGKIEPIGGSTAPQVDPNRPIQIKSALDALLNVRKLAQKTLSVGTQAERVSNYPVIGGLLGQNRADLEASLSLIEGNLIQDQLARLAKMNPGGMASLANSETEARRLASAIANLDPNQSEAEFLRGVERAENYYREQAKQLGIELPETPAQTGQQGAGPSITVTPEQSIQAFGQLTYDDKGQLVGDGYTGEAFDAAGNSLGLIGSVSEEALQQPAPSFYEGAINAVTGGDQSTATTERLPDWVEMPGINDLLSSAAWKTGLGTVFGGSPQEIAQIVQSNFPGTQVWQDEKGNYILRSATDGKDYAIKPGFQVSDIPRAVSTIGLGMLGGGGAGATALRTGAREAGIQAGVEGVQSATGGTFNTSDIAAAGVLGASGQKATDVFLPKVVQGVNAIRRGNIPTDGGVPPAGGMGGGPSGGTAFDLPGGIQLPGGRVSPAPQGAMPTGGAPAQNMGAMADEPFAPTTTTFRGGGAEGTSLTSQRINQAEGLPVPVSLTAGAATRDAEQLAFEKEQIFGALGGPLRKRADENNLQVLENFDRFIDQTGATATENIADSGNAVIKALSNGYQAAKNKVNVAYKRAEASEGAQEPVDYAELKAFIDGQDEATKELAPVLKSVQQQIAKNDPDGTGQITVATMENIRKLITKNAQQGTPSSVYGGEMKGIIDSLTAGKGGELYDKARKLRIEQARKFENRAIVARLVSNVKNMDDPKVAADEVFKKSIMNESPEDIKFLRQTLRTLGPEGRQAWSELQGATVRDIARKATTNSRLTADNLPVISAAGLNKAIQALEGNGRLDVIFTPKMAQQLRDLRDVVMYVNTVPPGTSINSSGTARTLAAMIGEGGATAWMTGGIPLPVLSGMKLIRNQIKDAKIKKQITRSLLPPEQN